MTTVVTAAIVEVKTVLADNRIRLGRAVVWWRNRKNLRLYTLAASEKLQEWSVQVSEAVKLCNEQSKA